MPIRTLQRWTLGWAALSNERAVANAREAATLCGQALVERHEVEAFLTAHAASLTPPNRRQAGEARVGGR